MNRTTEESFFVADSDDEEEETSNEGVSRFQKSKMLGSSPRVIGESESDEDDDDDEEAASEGFESAGSNRNETDSGTVDSEKEDMEFMNASHRVSIVVSSESESDEDSSPLVKARRNNLKRRSIYENPVSPYTPGNKSTPVNGQLKKRYKRVIAIEDSDLENVSVNLSRTTEKDENPIVINSDVEMEESDDQKTKQKELKKALHDLIDVDEESYGEETRELNGQRSSDEQEQSRESTRSPVDTQADSTYFDENMQVNSEEDNKEGTPMNRNQSVSYNGSVKRQPLNFENLKRHSSVHKKATSQHKFTDLLDESSDSSANNRSRAASVSSDVPVKRELFQEDRVVDLTINEPTFSGKEGKSNDEVIVCSSTSNSESEMDQDAVALAKKEIGVGNIDPIEAQKKELLMLKINKVQTQINKLEKFTQSLDIERLPDKGAKVHASMRDLQNELDTLNSKMERLQPRGTSNVRRFSTPKVKTESAVTPRAKDFLNGNAFDNETKFNIKNENGGNVKSEYEDQFEDFNVKAIPNVPKTDFDSRGLGKQAMETLNQQQSLTQQRLEQLHGSLTSRPTDEQRDEDPKGLKVPLMAHQQHALAWMKWRENQKPKGGILADDMGLGKTLTMISLILATVDNDKKDDSDSNSSSDDDEWYSRNSRKRYYAGTLVVCPASLINQWEGEVKKRVKKGLLSVLVFHGNNRQINDRKLSKYNIVVTTYQTLVREMDKESSFYKMEWNRIILDEAHVIRNHKSLSSIAACNMTSKRRWALTGTPIQNKEGDLYAILRFLKCSPFDDLQVWKRWVDNKNDAGKQRLVTLMKTLMLRRTKQELQAKGALDALPEKFYETIEIELDRDEKLVYQKILLFSQNLFAQFLAQRAEKDHMRELYGGKFDRASSLGSTTQFTKAQKLLLQHHTKLAVKQNIETHEILVLLLRLRQMCCHPALINKMLEKAEAELNGIDEEDNVNEDILHQLQNMSINEDDEEVDEHAANYQIDTKVATNLLTKNNPVFDNDRRSSKVRAVLSKIEEIVSIGDKLIVVSQWTGFLMVVAKHLKDIVDVKYKMFTGEVAIKDRQAIVDEFNSPHSDVNILFLSLTAGGVGLNLVGANHLLLIDLHWNPQLEAQAQDRIYRFGQKKNVHIYKFLCKETIEERIRQLQQKKLDCAEYVLTGTKSVSTKLTLNDLKLLFS